MPVESWARDSVIVRIYRIHFGLVAEIWGVGIHNAKYKIQAHWRYHIEIHQFGYNRLEKIICTDILFESEKYSLGNKCGQIFTTCFGSLRFFPFRKNGEAQLSLSDVLQEVRFPSGIHEYNAS